MPDRLNTRKGLLWESVYERLKDRGRVKDHHPTCVAGDPVTTLTNHFPSCTVLLLLQ